MNGTTRTPAPARPLPGREQVGFGTGGLATGTFTTVPGLVLLYYMTDTLGVAAGLAGLVVVVPKLLDLVVNPLVGRLSDRTVSRWGHRRPWMAVGGLLLPVAFALIFWSPFTGGAAALWVTLTFALAGVTFSMFVVPWSSLPAEIGPDSGTRTTMMSWRIGFIALAILLSGGLAPLLVELGGDGAAGYRTMTLFLAPLMLVAVVVATLVGARRSTGATATGTAGTGTLREAVAAVRGSRPLLVMFLVIMLCEAAAASALASAPYIADHVVGSEDALVPLFIAIVGPLLLTMPLWRRAAARHGKRAALRTAAGFFATGAVALVTLPFLPPDIRLLAGVAAAAVLGTGFAGTSMLPPAMFADAVAHEASASGRQRVGLLTGASNAAETIAGSLGAGLYAAALSVTGFVSSDGKQVTQSSTAQLGIVAGVGVVAVLVLTGVVLVLRGYPLHDADVDFGVDDLTATTAGAGAGAGAGAAG
jgi:GPH family glycoside/pentoside/hexuronide:cation symporter